MTPFALALVLAAAFVHASWNLLAKQARGGPIFVWLFAVTSAVIYLPLAVAVVVIERPVLGPVEFGFLTISAALHLGYFLLLQKGYEAGDLSVVYPTARATGPAISTLAAMMIFAERPGGIALIGGALIVVGVLFLTRTPAKHNRAGVASSLLYGVSAGLLIGSYTLWDTYAVSVLLIPPLLLDYVTTLGRVVMLAPHAARRRAEVTAIWRQYRRQVIGVAILNPLSYILVLTALVFTPISYVAPAREVSVLIAVFFGTYLLKEGHTRRRLGWSVVIMLGMVLLATH